MSEKAKVWTEWPLLFLCLSLVQTLLSSIRVPIVEHIYLVFIIVIYISLWRSPLKILLLTFILAIIASQNSVYSYMELYMFYLVTAFFAMVIVRNFKIETHQEFIYLSLAGFLVFRLLKSFYLVSNYNVAFSSLYSLSFIAELLGIALTSTILYPICLKWDYYFHHISDDPSDVSHQRYFKSKLT